jgi:hypothetical protein
MILLVVTIVIIMVSLAGFSFVDLMSTENKAVHLHGDEVQAQCAQGSGEELLKFFLDQSLDVQQDAGGTFDNPDLFSGALVVEDPVGQHHCRFSVVSPRMEDGAVRGIRFGVENESARLHLGSVLNWEQRQPGAGKQALMRLPNMTEAVADSILDWMDPDFDPRPLGAEADYYAGLMLPYVPRNAVPASLEELLLVKGVTRELLFGLNSATRPFDVAALVSGPDASTPAQPATTDLPWAMLLTVYSGERNLTPLGDPKINLNDPSLSALYQQLAAAFDAPTAEFVIACRQFGPYTGIGLPAPATGYHADLTTPAKFAFSSVLDLIGARVGVRGTLGGVMVMESPFSADPQAMHDYLGKLLDYLAIDAAPVVPGRINVNLAPQVVLGCIPGIDDALVTRIIAARGSPEPQDNPDHRSVAWLLTEGLVDLPQMKVLLPYVTAGGNVFRAQIVGYFDDGGPAARAEVIIDATRPPARQLYWKDLKMLGPGYPLELLGGGSPDQVSSLRGIRSGRGVGKLGKPTGESVN